MRWLGRNNLFFLLYDILGRVDFGHPWLLERCNEVQASPDENLDFWAREHYKSTIITYGLSIQDILSSHGDNPAPRWGGREATIGIFSHNKPTAESFLSQIKTDLEYNTGLRSLYPDILWENPKSSPSWSVRDGIVVRRKTNPKEKTVEAWGLVDSMPTGKHFFIQVYDDVVTEKSVATMEMIKKTTRQWELSLSLGAMGGKKRYIGTRYDEQDTYSVMLDRGSGTPRIYPATDDGSEDGQPVLLPQEDFEKKKRDMSKYIFSCQYLQNPAPDDENAFFRMIPGYTLQYYTKLPPRQRLRVYCTTDGAASEGSGDPTCHLVWGVDVDMNVYILGHYLEHVHAETWIAEQIKLARQHIPKVWLGEKGSIERMAAPLRKRMMREAGYNFRYELKPCDRDKPTRAIGFQMLWNSGRVFLPADAEWTDDYIFELKRFPNAATDDQVDSSSLLGLHLDVLGRGEKTKKEKEKVQRDYWVGDADPEPTNDPRLRGISQPSDAKDWRLRGLPGGGMKKKLADLAYTNWR